MPDSVLQTVITTGGVVGVGGITFIGVWITAARQAKNDEKKRQAERDTVTANNKIQMEVTHVASADRLRDDLQEELKAVKQDVKELKSEVKDWQAKWFEVREARMQDQQKISENERKIAELTEKYIRQKQDYEETLISMQADNVVLRGQVEKHTRRIEILEALMRENGVPIPPVEETKNDGKSADAQNVVLKGTMEVTA